MRAQSPVTKYKLLCFCRNIAAASILLWLLPPPQRSSSSRLQTSAETRIVAPVAGRILLPEITASREAVPEGGFIGHQEAHSDPRVDLVHLSPLQRNNIRKAHLGIKIIQVARGRLLSTGEDTQDHQEGKAGSSRHGALHHQVTTIRIIAGDLVTQMQITIIA